VKKLVFSILAIILISSLVLAGCAAPAPAPKPTPAPAPSPAPAPVIELKFSHHDPPDGPGGRATAQLGKNIEQATGGKVKVTMFPNSMIAAGPAQYDAVINGLADIGWSTHGFYPGRFPLTTLIQQPYMGIKNSTMGSTIIWNMFKTFPEVQAEYKDTKVLLLSTHQGAPIASKMAIKTLDDLKGKKIMSTAGGSLDWLKAAGAAPINMPPGQIYESMEKAILDGWTIDLVGAEGFKLAEVTSFYLLPYYYVNGFWVCMNQKKWDSLPKDIQDGIAKATGDAAVVPVFAKTWDSDDAASIQRMKIKPEQFNTLSAADIAKATDIAKGVWATEIATVTSKGAPAQKVFDYIQKAIADYK
jgi:TRAP-type C4-dicarboxylate transport system substrate-binding protein